MFLTLIFQCGCAEVNHDMHPSLAQVIFSTGPCNAKHCQATDPTWFDEQDREHWPTNADFNALIEFQERVDSREIDALDVVFEYRRIRPWFTDAHLRTVLPPALANVFNDREPLDQQLEAYLTSPVELSKKWLERAAHLTDSCAPLAHRQFALGSLRSALDEAVYRHEHLNFAVQDLAHLANNPTACFRLNGEPFLYEPEFGRTELVVLGSCRESGARVLEQPFSHALARTVEKLLDHLRALGTLPAPLPVPPKKSLQPAPSRKRKREDPDPACAHLDRVWEGFERGQRKRRREIIFEARAAPIDFKSCKRS
ncbi:hypothetical protein H2203_004363 [Taxawa tesnikishii (nom. ined.)]|nr:hypothetical protein H2203_004363 [Dothideales sp. JES 119]